ncbi:hypothetical protein ES332_D07G010700v1 [Gossypium tomentosum]|uniref:Uncharacterized protein n=1 Tax=Gossypium tomentosum TaxID=34277 RepID=A0A5D2K181_GOSTO|nr:hypothetical protein ES332_D07G010700v1 [Gossypium tomentosum]
MLRPNSLRMTVNSISLNSMSLMRSEKAIAGIPLTMDIFTSPSISSKSISSFSKIPSRFPSDEATPPPKSLSLKDIIGC